MADPAEIILEVPKEVVENCKGFSMDFGASAVKLVYRHKDDWEELQSQAPSVKTAKLRLRTYARPDYKEALELLKQSCYITRGSEETLMYNTGIGSFEFSENITKTMNVRTKVIFELDCLIKGFYYLGERIPRQQFEYAQNEKVKAQLRVLQEGQLKLMGAWKKMTDAKQTNMTLPDESYFLTLKIKAAEPELASDKPLTTTLPDMYPCIVAQAGSGFNFVRVNGDGSFDIIDSSPRGGRTFLGLGSLLVGTTTTYAKLMELAAKGNNRNVDMYKSDFKPKDPPADKGDGKADDIYTSMVNDDDILDEVVFCYGKAASTQTGASAGTLILANAFDKFNNSLWCSH